MVFATNTGTGLTPNQPLLQGVPMTRTPLPRMKNNTGTWLHVRNRRQKKTTPLEQTLSVPFTLFHSPARPAATRTLALATRPTLTCLWAERTRGWASPTCSDEDVGVPQQGGQRRPLLALSRKQGLDAAAWPVQRPPRPAAYLWLHTGRLEHEELNGYNERKTKGVAPNPSQYTCPGQGRGPQVDSPPSKSTRAASTRNGAAFPTNSYSTLPKGGPTARRRKRTMPGPRASAQPTAPGYPFVSYVPLFCSKSSLKWPLYVIASSVS